MVNVRNEFTGVLCCVCVREKKTRNKGSLARGSHQMKTVKVCADTWPDQPDMPAKLLWPPIANMIPIMATGWSQKPRTRNHAFSFHVISSHFMSFHLISSHFVLSPRGVSMYVCVCARWRAWIACWGKVVWTGVRWNGMSFIHDVKFQGKNNGTLNLFWIKIHQRHWKAKRAKGFICEQPPPFSQAKQDWRMGDIRVIDFPSKRKERHVGENQSLREPQWRGNISRPRQH